MIINIQNLATNIFLAVLTSCIQIRDYGMEGITIVIEEVQYDEAVSGGIL